MAHEAKSSTDVADSLFGPVDTAADDLFAAVVDSSAAHESAESATPVQTQPDLATDEPPAAPVAVAEDAGDLFGPSDAAVDALFGAVVDAQTDAAHAFDAALAEPNANDGQDVEYDPQNGYFDDEGNWYEYLPDEPTATAPAATSSSADAYSQYYSQSSSTTQSQTQTQQQSSHAPVDTNSYYQPTQQQSYAQDSALNQYYNQSAYTPATQQQTTATSTYSSAYAPAMTATPAYAPPALAASSYASPAVPVAPVSNAYAPTANTYAPAVPAAPASNGYAPTSTYPATTNSYALPAQGTAYAPASAYAAPPAPATPYNAYTSSPPALPQSSLSRDDTIKPRKTANVSTFRSESRNAYDPPMPAVSARPRYSSHATAPAPATSAYSAYTQPQQQQPPPPPQLSPPPPGPPRAVSAAPPHGPPRPKSSLSPPPPRPTSSFASHPAVAATHPPPIIPAHPANGPTAFYSSPPPQTFSSPPPPTRPAYGQMPAHSSPPPSRPVGLGYGQPTEPALHPSYNGHTAGAAMQHGSSWGEEEDPEGGSYQPPRYAAVPEEDDPEAGGPPPPPPSSYALPPAASHYAPPHGGIAGHPPLPAHVALPPSRTASRASVMTPPPRTGSVVSNAPSRTSPPPAGNAYGLPSQRVAPTPPPRAPSVISRPSSVASRPASVASPPPRAPSVASRPTSVSSVSQTQGKYGPPSRSGTPHSTAGSVGSAGQHAFSPSDPYGPPLKTAIPGRRESVTTMSPLQQQQPDPYRARGESVTSVGSGGSAGSAGKSASAGGPYAPPAPGVSAYAPPVAVNGTSAYPSPPVAAARSYAPPVPGLAPATDVYSPPAPATRAPAAPYAPAAPSTGLYTPANGPASNYASPAAAAGPYGPANGTTPAAGPYGIANGHAADPYGPASRVVRREASEVSDYGAGGTSRTGFPGPQTHMLDTSAANMAAASAGAPGSANYGYAPSPSLSGTNDPLGRTGVRIPLVRFGFGGRVVTCFHTPPGLTDGFDVSFSARPATELQVRRLHELVPASAWETSEAKFPGPLLSDPGSPVSSLVPRTGATAGKAKKAAVIKYLDTRIEEMEKGVGYASEATLDGARTSSKLVLVRLLKVLVENDGQTSGSDTIDAAVRGALLGERGAVTAVDSMRPADAMMSAYSTAATSEAPLAVYELRGSTLDKLQEFLLRGERRKAYHYALDEKMWAHALVLSSSLDKEAWKEAVQEFLRAELMAPAAGASSASNGRESLRILYSLIAGQAGSSVNELVPPKALGQPRFSDSLAATTLSPLGPTPMTANFSQPTIPTNISADILGKWQDIAATIVSNRVPGDSNGLTALGDTLAGHKWIEAAHVCYLLSRSTSTISGCSNTSSPRLVLVGSANPFKTHNFSKDSDPFIFSEILEYALSLAPTTPGQEPFHGFPHLQSYRLLHAWQLVEMGHDKLAQRYCDAIASTLRTINRGSPFFTLTFLEQLKELTERLVAAPQLEKTGFSLLRKVAGKTSVESVSAWFGTRITEFVAGESVDESSPAASSTNDASKQPAGPFGAHYSSISSAATSANSSPPLNGGSLPNGQPDLRRAGSALQLRSNTAPSIQIDRAASAMDYLRPELKKVSPVQRIASASAATSTFAQAGALSHPYGGGPYGAAPYGAGAGPYSPVSPAHPTSAKSTGEEGEAPAQEVNMPWWGNNYGDDSGATPTASSFVRTDDTASTETSGFMSLMDTPSPVPSSTPSASVSRQESSYEDDDDDLGFGNKKKPVRKDTDTEDDESDDPKKKEKPRPPPVAVSAAAAKSPDSPKPSGSWWPSLWGKKNAEGGGPVRANLGNENRMVYDKELKRWIDPKAPRPTAAPSTPPPPPRSQTSSPSVGPPSGPPSTVSTPVNGAPPRRPASVTDLSLNKPPRARSNLVPTDDESSSVPGTPPPPGASTPPIRPGAKRNVRSRYVDVFQQ